MSENRKLQTNAPTPVIAPRKVYVIGHKNPDTDSDLLGHSLMQISEAAGYRRMGSLRPCGPVEISQETQYVLDRFQVDAPGYVPNVAPTGKRHGDPPDRRRGQ